VSHTAGTVTFAIVTDRYLFRVIRGVSVGSCVRSARSGGIGECRVELRETCQVETGAEGLTRGARGL
jgi:hypothetical protein